MNNRKNTSVTKRVAIGAASIVAAGAFAGVGAQAAFADTGDSGHASSWSSASWSSPSDLGHDLFSGHLNGAKAQALAKRIVADAPLFSLLPDTLQQDLSTLKDASVSQRTADAKKIVSTALSGGYGNTIKDLAAQLKDASAHSGAADELKGLIAQVTSGDLAGQALGDDGAKVAVDVTADAQLSAKLPDSLRTDLASLAAAPQTERTADVQKIVTTALAGGYGGNVEQLAQQFAQHLNDAR